MIEKFAWRPVSYKTQSSANSKPCPRWGHSSCTIGKDVILFGGYAQSVYMNDLWIFDTQAMQWSEVKTTGTVPTPRSNCSISYDSVNNRIVFFGGGGSNKTRFNTINILDWETKCWSEIIYQENQTVPWQRTYHTAQLLSPYLIIYGGQGIADLDDLWVFNFETKAWTEITIPKEETKPCGRRFHSSCLIGNQFYVIAGCHSKYRCLNDIYSIDLTQLIKNGVASNLQWKQRQYKGTALLSRWGHSSASFGNKIYIFGGRFSTDLNDLLIFDAEKENLKILKVSQESLPKPRRRPSTCFVGSCLLMFGGFNSEYYNDLHFINVGENPLKSKNTICTSLTENSKIQYINSLVNWSQGCDNFIRSSDCDFVPVFKDLLVTAFEDQEKMEDFLFMIDRQLSNQSLKKALSVLYLGYGKLDLPEKFQIQLPRNQQQKLRQTRKNLQEQILISSPLSFLAKHKNLVNIIQLSDQKFGEMIQKSRQQIKKNVSLVINKKYVLDSNSHLLSLNSEFFRALFSNKYQEKSSSTKNTVCLTLPDENIVLFEVLINCLIYGVLVIPQDMSYQSWMQMYQLAEYFCFKHLKDICIYQLSLKIDETTVNRIFSFSKIEEIDSLAECCAMFKIKMLTNFTEQPLNEKYIKKMFTMNRFDIMQKVMLQPEPKLFKHKSESTNTSQGEKQNYEVCN